jgi:hypothetical protein
MNAIAADRSLRSIDADGHMRVEQSYISKACVSRYLGSEIPGFEALGLDPAKTYRLYRDPAELAKAADSFTSKPLLIRHVPISAEEPRKDLWVGTTGTVTFEAPYLVSRPLMVWTDEAIGLIESEQQRELSAGYRYTPVMRAGTTPDGEPFDGVMTGISGQHVAIVAEGRAGSDVLVADEILEEMKAMNKSTAAAKIVKAIAPYLAASVDRRQVAIALDEAMGPVDHDNFARLDEQDKERGFYGNRAEDWAEMSADARKAARDVWRGKRRAKDSGEVDHRKDFEGAKDSVRKQMLAAFAAREAVKPIVGIIAMDAAGMDRAEDIFRFALKHAGVKIDGVHPSAFPTLVEYELAKRARPAIASDARSYTHSVSTIWPAVGGGRRSA